MFWITSGHPSNPGGKTKEKIMMVQTGILIASFLLLVSGAWANSKTDTANVLAGEASDPEGTSVEFRNAMHGSFPEPSTEGYSRKDVQTVKLLLYTAKQTGSNSRECYPHISYAITLANTLGQVKHANGIDIRGDHQMEIYVNPKTLTWTLVLIVPSGLACKIGNGTEILIKPLPFGM
jgi:hypothetical protein